MQFLKLTFILTLAATIVTGCGGAINTQIGGNVTGLASGSSVGLINNSNGDTITVTFNSSDSSFTFDQSLADGASYNVTVSTQPTGQICSVTNGTGTASSNSGDVTNIQVNCVVGTGVKVPVYASVLGLTSGSTVVLLLNGDLLNTLSVTLAGGTTMLAFPQTLLPGAPYVVSVEPGTPATQTCTVQAASGTGTIPTTGSPSPAIVLCV